MKDVSITKPIIPDDIPQIEEVLYQSWLDTYPNKEMGITIEDVDTLFKDREQRIAQRLKHLTHLPSNELFLVAKKNNTVIGMCRIVDHGHYNHLKAIYVMPKYQNMGIGTALWLHISKLANQNQKTIVHVASYNKQAIDFYMGLGFVDTGKRFTEERHRMPKSGILIPEIEMGREAPFHSEHTP